MKKYLISLLATILIFQGLKIDVASAVTYTKTTLGATQNNPKMIVLDSAGNIYTVDQGSNRVTVQLYVVVF
jgi:hypothetical protein